MIDSGAFSAWARGVQIDVHEYAEWLIANGRRTKPRYDVAVNLDVIPGRGITPEEAARQSLENYQILAKTKLPILPVFHYGEGIHWLKEILALKTGYIGLGGIAKAPAKTRRHWLERVWSLCAGTKVHLFGVSAIDIVVKYKPYSFDSISCQQFAATGNVCFPSHGKVVKLHTDQMHGTRAQYVEQLCKPLGVTVKMMKDHYWARARVSAWTINNATKSIFIAGLSNRDYIRKSFLPAGCRNWLMSYWSIKNREIGLMEGIRLAELYDRLKKEKDSNALHLLTDGRLEWDLT